MKPEELQNRKKTLVAHSGTVVQNMEEITQESSRVLEIAKNSESVIKEIEDKFEFQTKLNKQDISFLFLAIALQCARQCFITDFKERVGHKKAEKDGGKLKIFERLFGKLGFRRYCKFV